MNNFYDFLKKNNIKIKNKGNIYLKGNKQK
jgi:hypothetical protein